MEARKHSRPYSFAVIALWLLFAGSPARAEIDLGKDLILENITYDLQDTDMAGVKKYVMEADFKGSKDQVCGIVCDYYNLHTYMPKEFDSKVVKYEQNQITLNVVLDLPWPFRDLESILLIDFDKDQGRAKWELIDGNIKRNDGTIEIEERGTYSHMKQVTYLDIGRYYPDWFLKIYTRSLTYRIMRAIRGRLEAEAKVYTKPHTISRTPPRP